MLTSVFGLSMTSAKGRRHDTNDSASSVPPLSSVGIAKDQLIGGTLSYMHMSNKFGSCASGSVVAPIMAANSLITLGLPRNFLRVRLAIHSSTSISRQAARVGAQLSMAVSGESAMVREGTGKPDAEAA